jgi:signal transduction histidine kinase
MQDRSKLAEAVLDQLADAVICADRSGAIILWNRASEALHRLKGLAEGRAFRPDREG